MTYREQLVEAKRQIVSKALRGRTITEAAKRLGVHRQHLHKLMQKLSIPSPNPGHRGFS